MAMTAKAIAEVHSVFGTSCDILFRRRALYSATIEVAGGHGAPLTDTDLLDSPIVRGHLGEVLSGRETLSDTHMVPLSELGTLRDDEPDMPRIAVGSTLDGPLRTVSSRTGTAVGPIMSSSHHAFDGAAQRIAEGVAVLRRISPDLARDVLPHIALIAVVTRDSRLGSASYRELPGLVVLPEPESSLEIAEALAHEGAHQRFFDLGVTTSLLDASAFTGPGYRASWSTDTSAQWPIEQCLAAFHAYRCLAALELARVEDGASRHPFSLLPDAEERGDELGEHLIRCSDRLGPDGRRLVGLLTGRPLRAGTDGPLEESVVDDTATVRDCGDRILLAFGGSPIRLVWQPTSTASG